MCVLSSQDLTLFKPGVRLFGPDSASKWNARSKARSVIEDKLNSSLKFCAFSFVDPYWIVSLINFQEQQPIIFISLNWWKHIAVWVIDFIRVPNKENRSDLSTTQCHKLVHLSLNAPKSKICVLLKIMALIKVLPK